MRAGAFLISAAWTAFYVWTGKPEYLLLANLWSMAAIILSAINKGDK